MLTMLGVDPGFAACGYAQVEVDAQLNVSVARVGVIRTQKSSKKDRVLACSDNTRRLREISRRLHELVDGSSVVCSESPSHGHKNAVVTFQVGLMWGCLLSHAQRSGKPVLEVSPAQMRKRLGLKANAGKKDIEALVRSRFDARRLDALLRDPKSMHVHAYDALAAVLACLDSDEVRLALAMQEAPRATP